MDIVQAGNRLLLGGAFTVIGGQPRPGLASISATTGAWDTYLTVGVSGNHNWDGTGARAPVGVDKLAISPDGTQAVAIGNFKNANGTLHDQVVKLDLGATSATIANWNTDDYQPRCNWQTFDSYVRDVAYSPDGSYFVIVTTGAHWPGTRCDSATRWSSTATGTNVNATWANYSGGDTLHSVAITEKAVYVGGHMRWMNNPLANNVAGPGAVPRPSLAALDPASGVPMNWLSGRNPRGFGVTELRATPDGLWLGYDTSWMGERQYRRERIAYLPLAGGATPIGYTTTTLPGKIYFGGSGTSTILYRVNAGGPQIPAIDGGPVWAADTAAAPSPLGPGATTTAASYPPVPSLHSTVPLSTPSAIFSDERWDPAAAPEMEWNFPVPAGTNIEVRLYLANRYSLTGTIGKRRFNVNIDGVNKLSNFDIVAAVGHDRGMMAAFPIVSDGNVDVDFGHVLENPLVDAIEIVGANTISSRTYDGNTAVGAATPVTNPDGIVWSTTRGAFWVGGTLYVAMNGALHRRTFNGTTFGPTSLVDPYHDPFWDTVLTDAPNNQTFAGATTNFYAEIANLTGMYYRSGRVYYTLAGQTGLYYRWFSPDSGVLGSEKFTLTSQAAFANAGAVFVTSTRFYMVNRLDGTLSRADLVNGVPSATMTVVSGPGVDGVDWRANSVFMAP